MTHTPGPWVAVSDYVEAHDLDEPLSICTLADCGDASKANARLIAAAPELMAALEEFIGAVDAGCAFKDASIVEYARAAIAKAKGE